MSLTPVEIRHLQPARGLLGYGRPAVDRLLAEIADSFEDVWRERGDMADRVEHLDTELKRHKELEALLRTTLVSAERSAAELKEQARREADQIVSEAHAEARAVTRRASAEHERLQGDLRRVKALMRAALATVDESEAGAATTPEAKNGADETTGEIRRLAAS